MEEIKIITHRAYLEKVDFVRKEDSNPNLPLKVNTIDTFENVNLTSEAITFQFKRHVFLTPEALFDVTIIFRYTAKINTINTKEIKIDNTFLSTFLKRTVIPQYSSLIISNLTVVNGGNPLVTIPQIASNK